MTRILISEKERIAGQIEDRFNQRFAEIKRANAQATETAKQEAKAQIENEYNFGPMIARYRGLEENLKQARAMVEAYAKEINKKVQELSGERIYVSSPESSITELINKKSEERLLSGGTLPHLAEIRKLGEEQYRLKTRLWAATSMEEAREIIAEAERIFARNG